MRHPTVRNVPPDLARHLDLERRRRGTSLNQTVIDLLKAATGVGPDAPAGNGLDRFAGTWTDADADAFDRATADLRTVDEEMWT